jgi:hypothetical protein
LEPPSPVPVSVEEPEQPVATQRVNIALARQKPAGLRSAFSADGSSFDVRATTRLYQSDDAEDPKKSCR